MGKDDIKTEGEIPAGNKVVIEDYSFGPDMMVEEKNEIEIPY